MAQLKTRALFTVACGLGYETQGIRITELFDDRTDFSLFRLPLSLKSK